MKYGFRAYKTQVGEHVFWAAESKDLKGCVGQGDTLDEALDELSINEDEWLEAAEKYGIDIPQATIEKFNDYSNTDFETEILADLISQGYKGSELQNEFKNRQRKIRLAVKE